MTGRVQGVGFRYFVKDAAESLGLSGWVRNTMERSVECEAQGDEKDLADLCNRLREGPPLSRVTDVLTAELPPERADASFEITY